MGRQPVRLPPVPGRVAEAVICGQTSCLSRPSAVRNLHFVSANADQLFLVALSLSPEDRADLTDRLVASSAEAIVPEIEQAHLAEVRRRVARVEVGEVQLVPGEQVLAEGRAILAGLAGEQRTRRASQPR